MDYLYRPSISMFWLTSCEISRLGMFSRQSFVTEIGTKLTLHYAGRKRAEIPVYSFAKHSRLEHTTSIYSPHVLVLEGIFALYDPRVIELLDMGVS
jgi:pantothenate kinase